MHSYIPVQYPTPGSMSSRAEQRQGYDEVSFYSGALTGEKRKLMRQTQACDRCRSKKRKCDGLKPMCTNCARAGVRETGPSGEPLQCTYLAEAKKRGPKKGYRDALLERMASIEAIVKSTTGPPPGGMSSSGEGSSMSPPPSAASEAGENRGGMSALAVLTSAAASSPPIVPAPLNLSREQRQSLAQAGKAAGTGTRTEKESERLARLEALVSSGGSGLRPLAPKGAAPQSAYPQSQGTPSMSWTSTAGAARAVAEVGGNPSKRAENLEPVVTGNSWLSNASIEESLYSLESMVDGYGWLDSLTESLNPAFSAGPFSSGSSGSESMSNPFSAGIMGSATSLSTDGAPFSAASASTFPTSDASTRRTGSAGTNGPGAASPARSADARSSATGADGTATRAAPMHNFLPPLKSLSAERELTQLESHLVDVFFAYIHAEVLSLFDEAAFYGAAFPVCRHPSFLTDALCAVGSLFSTHPEVDKFGGRQQLASQFVKRSCEAISAAEESVSEARWEELDTLEAVQALAIISMVEFGMDRPLRAHKTFTSAIRRALRLKIDREDADVSINPLSIFQGRARKLTAAELEARRRTWEVCVMMDTCVGVVSGLPLLVEEAPYLYLITGRRLARPTAQETHEQALTRAMGHQRWQKCLKEPPTHTIFHEGIGGIAPSEPPPTVSTYNPETHVAIMQVCFLLRQVIRLNYGFRQAALPPKEWMDESMKSVEAAILRPPPDGQALHDALVDWHAGLPERLKAFNSLEDLVRKVMPSVRTGPHPLGERGFLSTFEFRCPGALMCASLYLTALSTLHLPRADDPRPIFRAGGGEAGSRASALRLTRYDVVVLARRAQNYMLRGIMPGLGASAAVPAQAEPRPAEKGKESYISASFRLSSFVNNGSRPSEDVPTSTGENSNPLTLLATHAAATKEGPPGGEKGSDSGARAKKDGNLDAPSDKRSDLEKFGCTSAFAEARAQRRQPVTNLPPPAHSIAITPFYAFYVFTLSAAALAVSGFTSKNGLNGLSEEAAEVERGVLLTNLPTADRLAIVWPMAGVYASRLRSVLKAVTTKWEQDRKAAIG
ncbi:hypothetical protein HDU96_000737 [Phlyctochytrium bullatum]|nr:hypothetical protein HDU96_000737 [Phlyctochytrium bullatum]